jgi:thioredoxin-related protein
MKKIIALLFCSIFILSFNVAQKDSISFFKSWAQAQKASKKTGKPIFLDAFTTWCGPCKQMNVSTFKDAKVIALLNESFTPVKLDMERGEGPALARLYRIGGYPTFLFCDAEGNVLHSDAGFKNSESFLSLCQTALNPNERLAAWDAKFKQGNWDGDFLKEYIAKRSILANASQDEAIEAYLKRLPDWTSPDAMDFIWKDVLSPGSLGFAFLVDKKELFVQKFGKNAVNQRIEGSIYDELMRGSHRTPPETLNPIIDKIYGTEAAIYKSKYLITYFRSVIDAPGYMKAVKDYAAQYPPDDPATWADFAVGASFITKDKAQLNLALQWLDDALKKEPTFECHIAKAYVYKAMDKKKKAKKAAEAAIAWAKENQEAYAPATNFLSTF